MDVSIGWWTKSLLKKMVGNHQTSIHENIAWLSGPVCPALPGLWGSCAKHHENCYQMRWFQSFFVEFSSRCSWGQWFPDFWLEKKYLELQGQSFCFNGWTFGDFPTIFDKDFESSLSHGEMIQFDEHIFFRWVENINETHVTIFHLPNTKGCIYIHYQDSLLINSCFWFP